MNDTIYKSTVEQKLRTLEAIWQLLANRLLDDTRAGESDESSPLSKNDVTQHRKARRYSTGRWIREYRDEQPAHFIETRQGGRSFRHLHE